ncbi:DUF4240 domain-containing protein [Streptomyces sp. TLI_171]|uniref:DUF4240 domain-containing protein n=1 Tax=Streptomyces sp. TLI_171 TaxID=1938859 RepID=UPI000C6213C2|nr:DUF4240 domain-containing protein [Streptomyces sp. TLI_171]RKE22592.1 uncharacterized protein DUF4240 [Streptomyces sp. TLI_171]
MDVDGFWALLESSRSGGAEGTRAERLTELLAELPLTEVVEFQLRLDEARAPLDTAATLALAKLVLRGQVSDDGLWYFHAWLVGLGRDAHRLAVHEPDALAGHAAFRRLAELPYEHWDDGDFPDWEELDYCAQEAYARLTGAEDGLEEALTAIGHDSPLNADAVGPIWTAEQRAARLPRLTALFAEAR